jgi:hypothetical protein
MDDKLGLRAVDISNQPKDECQFVVDANVDPFFSCAFLFPVCLILATLVGSLGFPPKSSCSVQRSPAGDDVVVGMLSGISPLSYPLAASLDFLGPSFAISGSLNVTCTLHNLPVLDTCVGLEPTVVRANVGVLAFRPIAVTFDSCRLALSFRSSARLPTTEVRWSFANPLWSMGMSILRVLFFTPLLPYLLFFVVQATRSPDQVLERWLTTLMSVATVLFLDPLYVTQLFAPSAGRQMCHLAFRDIYFGYLAFYLIALFLPDGVNLAIPVVAMVLLSSVLFAHDLFIADTRHGILPRPAPPDAMSPGHFCVVCLLEVALVVRIFVVAVPESRALRGRRYGIVAMTFVGLLILLVACEVFADRFLLNARELITMSVVTAFALVMEYFHSDADDAWYGGTVRDGGPDSQLGVDEDSDRIGKIVKMEAAPSDL